MQQYSPVLGDKLQFPETWKAVVLSIGSKGFGFWSTDNEQTAITVKNAYVNAPSMQIWIFFHFHEMIHATQNQEKENRQFCMMVDMVSWYCSGPGTVSGLNPAPELPF